MIAAYLQSLHLWVDELLITRRAFSLIRTLLASVLLGFGSERRLPPLRPPSQGQVTRRLFSLSRELHQQPTPYHTNLSTTPPERGTAEAHPRSLSNLAHPDTPMAGRQDLSCPRLHYCLSMHHSLVMWSSGRLEAGEVRGHGQQRPHYLLLVHAQARRAAVVAQRLERAEELLVPRIVRRLLRASHEGTRLCAQLGVPHCSGEVNGWFTRRPTRRPTCRQGVARLGVKGVAEKEEKSSRCQLHRGHLKRWRRLSAERVPQRALQRERRGRESASGCRNDAGKGMDGLRACRVLEHPLAVGHELNHIEPQRKQLELASRVHAAGSCVADCVNGNGHPHHRRLAAHCLQLQGEEDAERERRLLCHGLAHHLGGRDVGRGGERSAQHGERLLNEGEVRRIMRPLGTKWSADGGRSIHTGCCEVRLQRSFHEDAHHGGRAHCAWKQSYDYEGDWLRHALAQLHREGA
mmetsp:Transcript_25682/g.51558  ORF Transcript_25682/g.51558 Transcript_25682/m.51558 type:complete len:463 (-) Transcript_25682:595-1983(-)